MHILEWLNRNAGALQSIAAIVSVLLALITMFVLVITWLSVKAQAQAARELTGVAKQQTEAAVASAEAAKKQTEAAVASAESAQRQSTLLSEQLEQSTAPLLVCEQDQHDARLLKITNQGLGVAFKVCYWIGEQKENNPQIVGVQPPTIGAGQFVRIKVCNDVPIVTVRYKGLDRHFRWTVFNRDPLKGQDHIVQKGQQEIYLS